MAILSLRVRAPIRRRCAPRLFIGSNFPQGAFIDGFGYPPDATAQCAGSPPTGAWSSRCRKRERAMAEVEMLSGAEPAQGASALPALPAEALIIVPVRNTVLFPGLVLPVTLGRSKSIAAAQQAVRDQRQVGILMQREAEVADPTPLDMHRTGTLANIVRYITAPDGTHHLVCQGEQRFQIVEYLGGWPFFVARVLQIPEPDTRTSEIEARFVNLKAQTVEAIQLLPQVPAELLAAIQSIETPGSLA